MKNKKAQEEIIGFGLIIIIVAVILLVFIGFSIKKGGEKETVESYEVSSFIQAFLQYTTECRDVNEYLSVQKLIFACKESEKCLDERDSCEVLNSTLKEIIDASWKVGEYRPVKAYNLEILSGEEEILLMKKGNFTQDSRGSSQNFFKGGENIDIFFEVYY